LNLNATIRESNANNNHNAGVDRHDHRRPRNGQICRNGALKTNFSPRPNATARWAPS